MCGIAGLFVRNTSKRRELGRLFTPMIEALTERGPDSAGIAVYHDSVEAGQLKYSLCAEDDTFDWNALGRRIGDELSSDATIKPVGKYAIATCVETDPSLPQWLDAAAPEVRVMGVGREMEIYKDVGLPGDVAARYGIAEMAGTCMIGHTRMATESAVNVEGSHPFTAGPDLCVVHNGSYANHNSIRREMARDGITCDSWNDTEVGARFIQWRLGKGKSLKESLVEMVERFSGFFTLAIGLRGEFAITRDPYACKPMVVAETDDYVACATEFRALSNLPGIEGASLYEPKPEGVYVWSL